MKKIIICGSMAFKDEMFAIANKLTTQGYEVALPVECIENKPKNTASRAHFSRIINKDTNAILVINNEKKKIKNYIGPNSFAEIAFAFYHNKEIYLLNDIYEPFKDELVGWSAIPLHGKLENIK